MLERILRHNPLIRCVGQHLRNQIEPGIVEPIRMRDRLAQRLWLPLREIRFVIRELGNTLPEGVVRSAKQPASTHDANASQHGLDVRIESTRRERVQGGVLKSGKHRKILKISSISESPGNKGWPVTISGMMVPTDHISTGHEYCFAPNRISGARYHNVTT